MRHAVLLQALQTEFLLTNARIMLFLQMKQTDRVHGINPKKVYASTSAYQGYIRELGADENSLVGFGYKNEGCPRVAWSVIAWQRFEGHPSFFPLQALQTDFRLTSVKRGVFLQADRMNQS